MSSISLLFLPTHGDQYLSSTRFKEKMSHIVKDLAGSTGSVSMRCVLYMKHRRDANLIGSTQVDLGASPQNGLTIFIERGE